MAGPDAPLLSFEDLLVFLRRVDRTKGPPLDLVLVGGAAVQLLCRDPDRQTRDIDALTCDALPELIRLASSHQPAIDLNPRAAMFEQFLPEDWTERLRLVFEGRRRLKVFVPSPEDLAVMKVYRMEAKDADDIAKLARLPGFDRARFLTGFVRTLPSSIGPSRRHAQSFALIWNDLFPDAEVLETDSILETAGIYHNDRSGPIG